MRFSTAEELQKVAVLVTTFPVACDPSAVRDLLPRHSQLVSAQALDDNSTFLVPPSNLGFPKSPSGLPALCALQVTVAGDNNSSYDMGLFLPRGWNGRFLYVWYLIAVMLQKANFAIERSAMEGLLAELTGRIW